VRVCLVYDCLFPWTVGGAERWYRNLGERLARDGHQITYLTLRQWERDAPPDVPGVTVVAVGPRMELYAGPGRRRILPPLVFGAGVLIHLLRHGRPYDAVHTASFPYFSLLAAGLARRRSGYRLVVDWHEVWTPEYWAEYLGRAGGTVGRAVQRICTRLPQRAYCFSELHARRLVAEGARVAPTVLRGEFAGPLEPRPGPPERAPLVVFAGRHIPEKRVPALVDAFARVRAERHGIGLALYGDGPDFDAVRRRIAAHGLGDAVTQHGRVGADEVDAALRRAACLVLPSRREGYGLVVVEAAACGTPSVVVAGPDNAATELIEEDENGTVAASADPDVLAGAILGVLDAGAPLRERTAAWFAAHAEELSLDASLRAVSAAYERAEGTRVTVSHERRNATASPWGGGSGPSHS
jgi:glycosyltransferase involved in cell wall biosynthesis